ncbi:hypothetical protein C446_06830 [Halobiforma nitratireducens JCM 10879]|uniref:HTH iclR-type domain-containing protein n=1 Tax=Halobiforma nitratireducens JCM 10879 TaxID=1227454 RepID=M0M583_9EURY|nr:hypothetical protein C446_06830 [Halobiforma nitratireducens JCM 10879]
MAFVPFAAAAVDSAGEVVGGAHAEAGESAGTEPAIADATLQEAPTESDELDAPDEVHIDVFVHENGSATFVVDYRFENNSESNWSALQDDVEAHPDAYAESEAADWNEILEAGQNVTERDMEIRNASVRTDTSSAPREIGHVEFTFEWHSFAYVELNRIDAGDALVGFTLSDDTTLRLFPPEGYVIGAVEPMPDDPPDGSVFWDGDATEFADDEPYVEILENGDAGAQEEEPDPGPTSPWLIVIVALVLLATVGAAGWWVRHQEILAPNEDADTAGAEGNGATAAGTGTGTGTGPDATGANGSNPDGPPPELLSNEERVLRLLEQRGGRIKQQDVVSELDWTEAKTSQVVGGLREDGEIEVFRIGRENVLALPDEDGGDERSENTDDA